MSQHCNVSLLVWCCSPPAVVSSRHWLFRKLAEIYFKSSYL